MPREARTDLDLGCTLDGFLKRTRHDGYDGYDGKDGVRLQLLDVCLSGGLLSGQVLAGTIDIVIHEELERERRELFVRVFSMLDKGDNHHRRCDVGID